MVKAHYSSSMEYDTSAYFRENEDTEVKGFMVIETDEAEGYRIAEKWLRSGESPKWISYWIPEHQLADRLDADLCEYVGDLSDEQLAEVRVRVSQKDTPQAKASVGSQSA